MHNTRQEELSTCPTVSSCSMCSIAKWTDLSFQGITIRDKGNKREPYETARKGSSQQLKESRIEK